MAESESQMGSITKGKQVFPLGIGKTLEQAALWLKNCSGSRRAAA